MPAALPHVPVLRFGREYDSLERKELAGIDGTPLVSISQVGAGIVRRDLARQKGTEALGDDQVYSGGESC